MDDLKLQDLAAWVTEAGLTGTEETAMLAGFCERALAAGLPLGSLVVVVDTLHPTHEGHAVRWRRSEPETVFFEYAAPTRARWRRTIGAAPSTSCSIPARPICASG